MKIFNVFFWQFKRKPKNKSISCILIHSILQLKYAKIDSKVNGSVKSGVVFSTYSSLISGTNSGNVSGKYNTRLKQLVDWFGRDYDGVIIFDECHKAKHLIPTGSSKPTKTGMNVLELQNQLPHARVVYASATGEYELKRFTNDSDLNPDFSAYLDDFFIHPIPKSPI